MDMQVWIGGEFAQPFPSPWPCHVSFVRRCSYVQEA